MNIKLLTITGLSLLLVSTSWAHPGGRRPESNQSGTTESATKPKRQRVTLIASTGFESEKIVAGLGSDLSKNKKSIARFTAKVKIPLPTESLNVTTADDASDAVLHYVFSRNGVDYADCTLRFDSDEDDLVDEDSPEAEYKLDLELKKGGNSVRSRKGRCDINLATSGTQNGIPAIVTGDVVRAEAVISGGRVRFAEADL